jgi:hypothetical protein
MSSESSHPSVHACFEAAADGGLLSRNGLDGFEAIWSLEAPWVEEPNFRRQGWSGVSRLELDGPSDTPVVAYLKRQENHGYRSLLSPFRLRPTAFREYKRLLGMHAAAVTAPEVLYYGERKADRKLQAILITREIPHSVSFEDYLLRQDERAAMEVQRVLQDTAALIGRLHRHRFQHCALYGKHVLISGFQSDPPVSDPAAAQLVPYLIDVEKSRRRPSRISIALRDLNQFYRHAPWSGSQWRIFLEHYVIASRMRRWQSLLSWLIQRKAQRKQSRYRST